MAAVSSEKEIFYCNVAVFKIHSFEVHSFKCDHYLTENVPSILSPIFVEFLVVASLKYLPTRHLALLILKKLAIVVLLFFIKKYYPFQMAESRLDDFDFSIAVKGRIRYITHGNSAAPALSLDRE